MPTAQVAVDKAAYHFDKLYSYRIPDELGEQVQPGRRVRIPFGRANAPRTALVLCLEEAPEAKGLKSIGAVLDDAPVLDDEGLKLLRYLKEQTFCTWFDALRLLIPAGLGLKFDVRYEAGDTPLADDAGALEQVITAQLHEAGATLGEDRLLEQHGDKARAALSRLCAAGTLRRIELHRQQVRDEKITMLRACPDWTGKLTPKQKQAMDFLAENDSASLKETCYYAGVTRAVLDNLRDKGAVEYYDLTLDRNPYADAQAGDELVTLNPTQQAAFERLAALSEREPGRTALLYGVTGSGKTQVFLRLIERVLQRGQSALLLVPEISLTAQTLEQFHRRFGGRVAVLHSALSLGERMDEWRRVKRGEADVVVGTRSAVFAPVRNLGLLVIDEEQEHTYKSDKSPRFHARDVARVRCAHHGALLLLASATPSVESYHHAVQGRYELVRLDGRYGTAQLPPVEVVDMAQAENLSDTPSLSLRLREELYDNLQRGEQSILLLNRRGYSTLVKCSSCGAVAECPHCSVAMTYHVANDSLLCHYCGHQKPRPGRCEVCESEMVRYSGAGTQKLEGELRDVFPDARILRVDLDTTMSKFSHEKYFRAFAGGEYDIMIGTQMVAKGLNFPRVTLVGVLNADQSLYANDFRSFERTFALLTQVVGRGGRGELGGRALVQTYTPGNPVIQLAAEQDYPAFFRDEIHSRKLHLYPPFCALACLGFVGEKEREVRAAAQSTLDTLQRLAAERYRELPLRILGPAPAELLKTAGRYRYKLIIKCKNTAPTRALLREALDWYAKNIKSVGVFADFYYDGF